MINFWTGFYTITSLTMSKVKWRALAVIVTRSPTRLPILARFLTSLVSASLVFTTIAKREILTGLFTTGG